MECISSYTDYNMWYNAMRKAYTFYGQLAKLTLLFPDVTDLSPFPLGKTRIYTFVYEPPC